MTIEELRNLAWKGGDDRKAGHEEQALQIGCVKWFQLQYPEHVGVLLHPMNEGTRDGRVRGAIGKAMGVLAGAADLLLLMPDTTGAFHYLTMELKTQKGRQSAAQRAFEANVRRHGGAYVVIRSLEDFIDVCKRWIG